MMEAHQEDDDATHNAPGGMIKAHLVGRLFSEVLSYISISTDDSWPHQPLQAPAALGTQPLLMLVAWPVECSFSSSQPPLYLPGQVGPCSLCSQVVSCCCSVLCDRGPAVPVSRCKVELNSKEH